MAIHMAFAKTGERLNGELEPFDFYSEVIINRRDDVPEEVCNKKGIIMGRVQQRNDSWSYSVRIMEKGESYYLPHECLQWTGTTYSRSDLYGGKTMRVSVDEYGAGTIIDV